MEQDRQPTGRLQATLDEMKRRLEEDREAAELLTRRLTFHRDNRPVAGPARLSPSFSPIEAELSEARKQLNEQKALTEKWIEQVNTERDAGRARLRDADSKLLKLQEQLQAAQHQLNEQKEAAEGLIQQLVAASNGASSPSGDAAARMAALERELESARQQLCEQMQSAEGRIRLLTAERDQAQADGSGASNPALELELEAVRRQLAEQMKATEKQIQQLTAEHERMHSLLKQVENRTKALDDELVAAREQSKVSEAQISELAAERERIQAQASEAESRAKTLDEELVAMRQQLTAQRQAVEEQIQQLTSERDESRASYSEVESRTQLLEKEFIAAHEQFREQRETAVQVIRQLEMDREDAQARMDELDAQSVRLQGELTKARNDLEHETSKVAITTQVRTEILDAVVDIQVKGQKLLDLLQAWSAKDAGISLESDPGALFEQLLSLRPGIRTVHWLYRPARSGWLLEHAQAAARKYKLELNAIATDDARTSAQRYQEILNRADSATEAVWLSQDPALVSDDSTLPDILDRAWANNIVVFSGSVQHVAHGVLFALFPDNEAMGSNLAKLAIEHADGAPARFEPNRGLRRAINRRTAEHLSIRPEPGDYDLVLPAR